MNLYELTADFLQLQQLMEDPEADRKSIEAVMNDIECAIEDKADGYARIMKNLEAESDAIGAEITRLKERKSALETNIQKLKTNLQEAMITTGKRKFKTDLFTFSIQKNGGADPVIVDVPTEDLEDQFVIILEKPDLNAIRAYIKETGDITFAHFGERGESLRIK